MFSSKIEYLFDLDATFERSAQNRQIVDFEFPVKIAEDESLHRRAEVFPVEVPAENQRYMGYPVRNSVYGIAHWIPHITLIFGRDLNRENFCPAMERLVFRDFHREFEVNNLAILSGSLEGGIEIEKIFYFRGKHTLDR